MIHCRQSEMTRRAADFTTATIRALAARVGGLCSHPDCQALTSGPKHDSPDAVTVGVAAHITGAQPGGPRYDPTLSDTERQSAANGIWLCQTHARLIDVDNARFSVATLREWKANAELLASRHIGRPQAAVDVAPHALDFSLEQLFLARLGARHSQARGCIGVGFYNLAIVNRSTRSITLKEIVFRYREDDRISEVDSTVIRTGTIPQAKELANAAIIDSAFGRIVMMGWNNLRPLLARHSLLATGAVISGSAYYVLPSREWKSWRALDTCQLVVRDYWGQETAHAVDLPRDEVWSPDERTLLDAVFTQGPDGTLLFEPE